MTVAQLVTNSSGFHSDSATRWATGQKLNTKWRKTYHIQSIDGEKIYYGKDLNIFQFYPVNSFTKIILF